MKKLALFITLGILAASCAGGQKYKESLGDKEIKQTVNTMVASLYTYLKTDWKQPALIELQRIENHTSEHINTKMLASELVTNLIKKRIQFTDKAYTKEAIKEMEKGMTGLIDPESAVPTGQLKSPNLYLYGTITQNDKNIIVTLSLKEIKSGVVKWQEHKSFKRASGSDDISI